MSNVWTYWKCPSCDKVIRGDSRNCPDCGTPIPKDVKYMMPNHPLVMQAIQKGTISLQDNKHVDEKGIISEVVPENLENHNPNWVCDYCGCQNAADNIVCERCGAGKEHSQIDYFENKTTIPESEKSRIIQRTGNDIFEDSADSDNKTDENTNTEVPDSKHNSQNVFLLAWQWLLHIFSQHKTGCIITVGIAITIAFLLWLFIPVTEQGTIYGFSWERSTDVEEYTLCHEDDWTVPQGAVVTKQQSEIHHYDHVIDHYETKTRQVSHQELDGYDTTYKDLGNGQAEMVKEPRYKTVYETETYQDPVYKDVPVYKTKYYYDIGRWKVVDTLHSEGDNHNPYWPVTELPDNISNPAYGDKRQGARNEKYYVIILDKKEQQHKIQYKNSDWGELNQSDIIKYKKFRLSDKIIWHL